MGFSKKETDDVISEMNVTPLVDVMLVLLVVFIVTAPMLTNSIPLKLPKTGSVAPATAHKPLVVSITKEGKYFIGKQPVAYEDLEHDIAAEHDKNPELAVQIRADQDVVYSSVAKAMAVVQKAGINRLGVITDSSAASAP